jgi:serine/threonine-protein kinase
VSVGDIINGKYLVEAVIGQGGVGFVVRAQNLELDERVALKFLHPEMLAHKEIVARFAREAKAASSIRSEYVAMVFDVGTMANGTPYLVMEHLDGKDLSTVLAERGRLGPREAAEYAMQVCEALAVAHAKGVIHRDIKPDNLFVTTRSGMNFIKVLDFGISKTALTGSMFGNDLPVVKTVSLMGTPLYMSPEQVRSSQTVDERTDVWALGMVFYEMLAGCSPFKATSITELCAEILEKPLAPITAHRTDLPPALVHILEKCLEKNPAKRYQNVAELAMALMPFAPRRARICAERAAQALMAAGIIEESTIQITSTYPPPGSSTDPGLVTNTSPSFGLPPPSTPAIPAGASAVGTPPSSASWSTTGEAPAARASGALPVAAASHRDISSSVQLGPSDEFPQPKSKLPVFVAIAAAIAAAAAVAAWVRASSNGGPVPAAQASPPAVVQPAAPKPAEPANTATAAAAAATTTATTDGDPSVNAPKVAVPTRTWAAAATQPRWAPAPRSAPPAPAKSAAPAPTDNKKPAKKNNEEPDMGF